MKTNQKGIAHIGLILLLVVVLAAVGFAGWRVFGNGKNNSDSKSVGPSGNEVLKDCKGNGMVKMTSIPMNIDDMQTILPLGTLAKEHVTPIDHLYFYPKDMRNRDAAPVYAMADGYIVTYQERKQNVSTGESQKSEYRIDIQHNCDVVSYFDLLTSLDDSVTSQLKKDSFSQRIPVKAGQEIGRVGAQSLDTAIYNYGMKLSGFVKPESYSSEPWKIHTDDFFKYFDNPLRDKMLAKNPRQAEPRSGKIDYDIAGKLIGNWFEVGTNGYAGPKEFQNGRNPGGGRGYWNGHFSIAPDAIDPSYINLSFGTYQGRAEQFTAIEGSIDPAKVGEEQGIVKYEYTQFIPQSPTPTGGTQPRSNSVRGVALLQVLSNNQMKMEAFPDKTANQVNGFTSSAKIFER